MPDLVHLRYQIGSLYKLPRGVPAGAELEYTDVNTIAQAMLDRRAS